MFALKRFCNIFEIQLDAPTSDFIELYANQIAMLKRKIQALAKQNEILSESVSWAIENFNCLTFCSTLWSFSIFFSIKWQTMNLLGWRTHRLNGLNSHKIYSDQMKRKFVFSYNENRVSESLLFTIVSTHFFRLTAEIEKLNTIVTSMKTKFKTLLTENDESIRKLTQEKVIASKQIKELVSHSIIYFHQIPIKQFLIHFHSIY